MTPKSKCLKLVPCSEVGSTCESLLEQGFTLYTIDKPLTPVEFFSEAREKFPLDPLLSGRVHWDAFVDSIAGGLDASPSSKIGLVVRDASTFKRSFGYDFQVAIDSMSEAAEETESLKREDGDEEATIFVVVGID